MGFSIRHALPEDAEAILNVRNEAVLNKGSSYYSKDTLKNWAPEITPERVKKLQDQLAEDNDFWLVASDDDSSEIIGYCSLNSQNFTGGAMYIKPYKSSFVAIAFAKRMRKLLMAKNIKDISISASLNAEAIYKAMGFVTTGYDSYSLNSVEQMPCALMTLEIK